MECYVHIPFCRQKCRYCSFTSFTGQDAFFETYVDLLLKEAGIRKPEITSPLTTVYIGGGTPSLLPPSLLRRLIDGLRLRLGFESVLEMTSEANPGTVTPEWLDTAASAGLNRLSFGMQACQPSLLKILGRIHTAEQVSRSVSLARASGISNISLDLIFGIPGQTRAMWLETLHTALSLNPSHISAYGLIPEEGTPLFRDLGEGRISLPDPDEERAMYDDALRILSGLGMIQYEISNFAVKGYECIHNIGYWTQVPYLGLGVSAASMTCLRRENSGLSYLRRINPDTISAYRDMVENCLPPTSAERITPEEARFETLMLGLRMNRGVSETAFIGMHGISLEAYRGDRLHRLEQEGLLVHEDGYWRMSRRGFDIQNSILVDLMDS